MIRSHQQTFRASELRPAASEQPAAWVQSAERVLSLTLVLLTLFLIASFFCYAGGLWRDESNSVALASQTSVAAIVSHLDSDSFPLLWFLVLRVWVSAAPADLAIRALGLITAAGILAVILFSAKTYRIGFPYWSFLLLGLNPVVIRCITSTRAYGLGLLLVLLSAVLIWRACCRLNWRTGLAAFVSSLLCVHCLYYNIVFVGALCLGAMLVCWRRHNRHPVLFFAGLFTLDCVSLLPYLPTIMRQHEWSALITCPSSAANFCRVLAQALESAGGFMIWVWIAVTVLGIGLGLHHLKHQAVSPDIHLPDRSLYALVGMGAGVLGYGAFLFVLKYPTSPWYYVLPMAQTTMCLDILLGGIACQTWRVARTAVCFLLLALTFSAARSGVDVRQTGMDLAAAFVGPQARPNDLVLVSPWYDGATFMRYYRGAAPWQAVPLPEFFGYGGMDQMKRQMASSHPLDLVFARITRTLRGGGRVWLVGEVSSEWPGTRVMPLAPAPHSPAGWSCGAYVQNWGRQVQVFLLAHSAQNQIETASTAQAINGLENPQIEICAGWHEMPVSARHLRKP